MLDPLMGWHLPPVREVPLIGMRRGVEASNRHPLRPAPRAFVHGLDYRPADGSTIQDGDGFHVRCVREQIERLDV